MTDNRVQISYPKELNYQHLGEIWALAYYKLKEEDREGSLLAMQDRIKKSETPQETLKIIEDYACINGRLRPGEKKKKGKR